ncbi:hypothetical protein [Dialister succinatiphilus]|uniref:hypothetical protein n=2 Tax=Dialister succinatiphilus TaxID=487173 RepID=UPI004029F2FB
MKSSRKNSFTDLNNAHKYALFKVAHFQTNEKTLPERKGSVFLLPENQKLTTFAEKRPLLQKKIESLVPLRYSQDR